MPVELPTRFNESKPQDHAARDRAVEREAMSAAIRAVLLPLALGESVLIVGLFAMKSALLAAEGELNAGEHWFSALMPSALFGLFGVVFGGLIGWRATAGSGLAGRPVWLVGIMAVMGVTLTGVAVALAVFGGAVPVTAWLSLAVMAAGAVLAVTYFALWMGGE